MYLDTDITMALIGLDDILLGKLELDNRENLKTSIMTVFEIKDIVSEMDSDLELREIYKKIQNENIELLPFTSEILKLAIKLLDEYNELILFDTQHAINAAHCIHINETILSTDTLYKKIGDLKLKNPIKLQNQEDFFLMCEE